MDVPSNPAEETAFCDRKRNPKPQWFPHEHNAVSEVLWNYPLNVDSATPDLSDEVVCKRTAIHAGVGFFILSGLDRK